MVSPLDGFRASVDTSLAAERQATDTLLTQKDAQIATLQTANDTLTTQNTALVGGVQATITGLQTALESLPALQAQLQALIDALSALPLS